MPKNIFDNKLRKLRQFFLGFSLVLLLILISHVVEGSETVKIVQNIPQSTTSTTTNKIDGFPVILDGNTLFVVRRGVSGFTAEERANAINERLEKIAQDYSLSLDDLKIKFNAQENITYLSLNGTVIVTITAQDAQTYNFSQQELATRIIEIIKNTISQYRKDRSPAILTENLFYTVLSTITLLIIISLIIRWSAKLFPKLKKWIENCASSLKIQSFEMISAFRISMFCLRIMRLIRLSVILIIVYFYISFVFGLFPWTRPFSKSILKYFFQAFELVFNNFAAYLPNIFIIALIIAITSYILKIMKPFFTAIDRGNLVIPGFYADWAKPTYKLLLILIIALSCVVAFPYLPGFNSPAFQGISVFIGVLLSLGSSSAISNVVGGIVLIYTRSFVVGDRIQINDVVGDVIQKTLLVTRILTVTNKIITIPNSSILNSNVINFSVASRELERYLILQTTVTLGYDNPWRKVHDTLIEAALATNNILTEPNPFVLQTSLGDFYVSYQLNAYTNHPNLMVSIYSELHQNIQDKCNEVGIEIMSPHYGALRDGNQSTIPENYLPEDYKTPGFRISTSEEK
jgi:small-conductance mechanosensitive channel